MCGNMRWRPFWTMNHADPGLIALATEGSSGAKRTIPLVCCGRTFLGMSQILHGNPGLTRAYDNRIFSGSTVADQKLPLNWVQTSFSQMLRTRQHWLARRGGMHDARRCLGGSVCAVTRVAIYCEKMRNTVVGFTHSAWYEARALAQQQRVALTPVKSMIARQHHWTKCGI